MGDFSWEMNQLLKILIITLLAVSQEGRVNFPHLQLYAFEWLSSVSQLPTLFVQTQELSKRHII